MPRVYFHVLEGGKLIRDEGGLDLPGENLVSECQCAIREVLGEKEWAPLSDGSREFRVVDDSGATLIVVPF